MKNLINFIVRNSHILLFLCMETIAILLISNNKTYARSVLLSSTNMVTGWMYEKNSHIIEFFNLKANNKQLAIENANLRNRVTNLQNRLTAYTDTTHSDSWKKLPKHPEKEYRYTVAKVIRNTTHLPKNYLTLNKGSDDGIRPDMGVIANNAVVGIVQSVSPKFSKVISILHPITSISTKFKSNNYFGSLTWNGKDYQYANLNDIARHVKFSLGDTLTTSGLVKAFPEGINVGTIDYFDINESDSYYNINVKLSVDYHVLDYVQVVEYLNYDEQQMLEKSPYGVHTYQTQQ